MIRPFRTALLAVAAGLVLSVGAMAPAVMAAPSPAVTAALADPARPDTEKARDAGRKAAEVAEFTGIKPGDKVADIFPGGGYFTHIFAKVVGPKGVVWAVQTSPPKPSPTALGTDAAYPNIKLAVAPWDKFSPPEKLDMIFNSQFFHDLYNPEYGPLGGGETGVIAVSKAYYEALKPGGVYIVVDHAGRPGTGHSEMNTLHRIEKSEVTKLLTGIGFKLEAESDVLHNPDDPKTANVFDPSIRGKTDQFMLKFRKPK
jgi:predicted methyltransferase